MRYHFFNDLFVNFVNSKIKFSIKYYLLFFNKKYTCKYIPSIVSCSSVFFLFFGLESLASEDFLFWLELLPLFPSGYFLIKLELPELPVSEDFLLPPEPPEPLVSEDFLLPPEPPEPPVSEDFLLPVYHQNHQFQKISCSSFFFKDK